MTTSTDIPVAQLADMQSRFEKALRAFFVAREEFRAYLENLPAERFYYTDGYDPVSRRHDYARMKAYAIAHILSYTVLKSDNNAHPSHTEYHTGIIFDGARKPYTVFQLYRAAVAEQLQQAMPIRYYCARSGLLRPIYYQWFAQLQLPSVRIGTFSRSFTMLDQACPYLTVGTWHNVGWLPVSRRLYEELCHEHGEHAIHLGEDPGALSRQMSRASSRAVIRDGHGARTTLSLTLPLIYTQDMLPKDFSLRHYLWAKQKSSGRQLSSMRPIPFFSERYGIFRRI